MPQVHVYTVSRKVKERCAEDNHPPEPQKAHVTVVLWHKMMVGGIYNVSFAYIIFQLVAGQKFDFSYCSIGASGTFIKENV